MPLQELNGFRMHYELHEGLLPSDTLFIHGNLASNRWWHPTKEVLQRQAKPEYKGRAIFAEWRGCGKSTGPNFQAELNLKTVAQDYIDLARALDVSALNVVGHSAGGLIALQAMLLQPQLFTRALLLDPVGARGVTVDQDKLDIFLQMSQNRDLCAVAILGTIFGRELSPEMKLGIVNDAFGVHPLIWHGTIRMLTGIDLRSELPKIQQPVLVMHGELDSTLPETDSFDLAKLLPKGRFYRIPKHGHSLNLEDPELFAMHLNSFFFS